MNKKPDNVLDQDLGGKLNRVNQPSGSDRSEYLMSEEFTLLEA